MRLFIALTPSDAQKRQVEEVVRRPLAALLPGVRWVGGDTMHITLRFLGEVGEVRVGAITAALERAAAEVPPFALALGGPGVFPSERNARVLWLELAHGRAETEHLAAVIERELTADGFVPSPRAFSAHLTLGRLRAPLGTKAVRSALEACGGFGGIAALIERVTLYQSHLGPDGAAHVPLFHARFTG